MVPIQPKTLAVSGAWGNRLSGAAEEELGEEWEALGGRGGYGSGFGGDGWWYWEGLDSSKGVQYDEATTIKQSTVWRDAQGKQDNGSQR
jgi:hypothetical protein